jgi:hypothetical protein
LFYSLYTLFIIVLLSYCLNRYLQPYLCKHSCNKTKFGYCLNRCLIARYMPMSRATLESIIGDNTIEEIIEQTHENPD